MFKACFDGTDTHANSVANVKPISDQTALIAAKGMLIPFIAYIPKKRDRFLVLHAPTEVDYFLDSDAAGNAHNCNISLRANYFSLWDGWHRNDYKHFVLFLESSGQTIGSIAERDSLFIFDLQRLNSDDDWQGAAVSFLKGSQAAYDARTHAKLGNRPPSARIPHGKRVLTVDMSSPPNPIIEPDTCLFPHIVAEGVRDHVLFCSLHGNIRVNCAFWKSVCTVRARVQTRSEPPTSAPLAEYPLWLLCLCRANGRAAHVIRPSLTRRNIRNSTLLFRSSTGCFSSSA